MHNSYLAPRSRLANFRDKWAYVLSLFAPEILEARRRQLRIAHGVLDILMAKIILD